jgi:hypothetical protein
LDLLAWRISHMQEDERRIPSGIAFNVYHLLFFTCLSC